MGVGCELRTPPSPPPSACCECGMQRAEGICSCLLLVGTGFFRRG